MLTSREIVSTLEMLQSEHLDLRTVTLGINLMDCVSDDLEKLCHNIRVKIKTLARNLVPTCNQISDKYGIPVVNKRISISPIAIRNIWETVSPDNIQHNPGYRPIPDFASPHPSYVC